METSSVVDMSPWVSVIGAMVGWTAFIIVVGMLKSFISKGFSMSLASFLIENSSDEQIEKITRWFGNKDEILFELKEIKKGLSK